MGCTSSNSVETKGGGVEGRAAAYSDRPQQRKVIPHSANTIQQTPGQYTNRADRPGQGKARPGRKHE
jgi:hypothetical protein